MSLAIAEMLFNNLFDFLIPDKNANFSSEKRETSVSLYKKMLFISCHIVFCAQGKVAYALLDVIPRRSARYGSVAALYPTEPRPATPFTRSAAKDVTERVV